MISQYNKDKLYNQNDNYVTILFPVNFAILDENNIECYQDTLRLFLSREECVKMFNSKKGLKNGIADSVESQCRNFAYQILKKTYKMKVNKDNIKTFIVSVNKYIERFVAETKSY